MPSAAGLLDPERTRVAIRAAAARGRFISYKDVALASGLEWSAVVNSAMPKHLEAVCRQGQREGVPMLSAVVVRLGEVETGRLSDRALDGFIACAVRLGLDADGDDGKRRRFLEQEQDKVFAWAKERDA